MNEKTRIQIEEMKRQTIGVEVEMNNITRENAARIAADYFGTGRYKYTADLEKRKPKAMQHEDAVYIFISVLTDTQHRHSEI